MLAGLAFPVLLSGSVLVESVFSWPGMGRLAAEAIARRDYPLVTGAALLAAVMVVLGSLLADLAARAADPRLRSA
jgi:peptide/nickel transport system permease protein